jgi:hypothetical protein
LHVFSLYIIVDHTEKDYDGKSIRCDL